MNPQYAAAVEIQTFLKSHGWQFCIIGGLAVIRWGQARSTLDVDISLLTDLGKEVGYIDAILGSFSHRLPDARRFAVENRVILANASNGVALDISLATFPYEQRAIERASEFEFLPGVRLITASAEDMVVFKAFAGRDQDWADVTGITIRQRGQLDWQYIETELTSLLRIINSNDSLDRLRAIRRDSQQ